MRLVFDTNVLFAAYIARRTCAALYDQALAVTTMLTSDFILDEFKRTLVTKGKVASELALEARAKVTAHSRLVAIAPLAARVCRDPDDDAILATALAAQGTCL